MFGTTVPRRVRWAAILTILVFGVPASAQAPIGGEGQLGAAGIARKIRKQDRVGWRARLGARLERRLEEAVPSEGLRVSVVLARDDLPRRRGRARRAAVALRQGRVLGALPRGRFNVRRRFRSLSGFAAQVDADALDALMRHPEAAYVYIDGRVHGTLSEGSALVGTPAVHAQGYTGAGVKVAVLDTGIDAGHADLLDDVAAQHCFCAGGCCPSGVDESTSAQDDEGHGTAVSGIISSRGVQAPPGVAPNAKIVAIKVLDDTSSGSFSDIAAALDWILTESAIPGSPVEGVRVVNMSFGDGVAYNDPLLAPCTGSNTANAIQLLDGAGIAVVVSAGNDGHDDGISFPACVPEAISVGGVYDAAMFSVTWSGRCTDSRVRADTFVCHSNSDEILDVVAPDWRTTTSRNGGGTVAFGGTSAAAAYVAAEAALLFEANPALEPSEVRTLLTGHGPLVTNPDNGLAFRRTDIGAALASLTESACGNSLVESGETCDDGNTDNGDCCSASCALETAGSACDDGDACTSGDTCNGVGSCSGGSPLVCDDGLFCNGLETCDSGVGCQAGTPPFIRDWIGCTDDSCDELAEPTPH